MSETLETMLEAMPDSYQKTVGFPTYDLLAAAAIPMEELEAQLQETAAELDPANLTGEDLERYVKSRSGLVRNPPTCASGILQVTGNGTVNEGDLFESAGGIQFAATATVDTTGSGEVAIRCTTPGAAGNLPAGSVTMMPVQIAGIVSVSNSNALTGGYDAETDAGLL
ncbi:MAG: baseplate J/gp47 family protein [Dysosmobacter sp.]